jgi:hypothetical protein
MPADNRAGINKGLSQLTDKQVTDMVKGGVPAVVAQLNKDPRAQGRAQGWLNNDYANMGPFGKYPGYPGGLEALGKDLAAAKSAIEAREKAEAKAAADKAAADKAAADKAAADKAAKEAPTPGTGGPGIGHKGTGPGSGEKDGEGNKGTGIEGDTGKGSPGFVSPGGGDQSDLSDQLGLNDITSKPNVDMTLGALDLAPGMTEPSTGLDLPAIDVTAPAPAPAPAYPGSPQHFADSFDPFDAPAPSPAAPAPAPGPASAPADRGPSAPAPAVVDAVTGQMGRDVQAQTIAAIVVGDGIEPRLRERLLTGALAGEYGATARALTVSMLRQAA